MYYFAPPNDGTSERQYLDLLSATIDHGHERSDRTGTGTRALHGATMRFNLAGGVVPLLTTKLVPWKKCVVEMLWFLSGNTKIRPLLERKVSIWSDWPHAKYVEATGDCITKKEFEKRVLADEAFADAWGDIGPGYGKQWRCWQGPDGKIYDQVADLVKMIKQTPYSRRLLFHGWNVADIDKMALPPCHLLYQFFIADGKISCTLYQRSVDCGLGLPWNIFEAAMLVHMLAQQCDLEPGELFWVGHDVHVYLNHIEPLRTQLVRTPQAFPTLRLLRRPETLFDYAPEDFEVLGYDPQPAIAMDVAV